MQSIPLLVFAKAPIPGQVKTRLQTNCDQNQAAEIAKIILRNSLKNLCENWPGVVELSVWPDAHHTYFDELSRLYPISISPQAEGNLGDKMHEALTRRGFPAAVIGADVLSVDRSVLTLAYELLTEGKNVIGPAEDGGYYFLGASQPLKPLFREVDWGHSSVFQATLHNAAVSKIALQTLPSHFDIDTWEDVLRIKSKYPDLQEYLLREGLDSV